MAGLLCLQAAWLTVVPAFHGPDEFDHALRAASVARGHWGSSELSPDDGRGSLILVPEDVALAARDTCEALEYTGPDNCRPSSAPDADGQVLIASAASAYNPVYYTVVGSAARPFEGVAALYAMRLASLVLCDLLLAAALLLALRRRPSGWQALGLTLLLTPIFLYSTIVAAPNAVGYAAAVLLWTALLALPEDDDGPVGWTLAAVSVGVAIVTSTHTTGLMWVAAIALCGFPLWRRRLHVLRRHHPGKTLASGTIAALSAVACLVWIVSAGTNDPRSDDGDFGPAPAKLFLVMPAVWVLQSFATLRMRDQAAPMLVYALAVALLATLLTLAWRRSGRPARLTLVLVAAASLVAPLAATWVAHPYMGNAWQARYGFPLYVGIYLVALQSQVRQASPARLTSLGLALALGLIQVVTLWAFLRDEVEHGGWDGPTAWRYASIVVLCLAATGFLHLSSRQMAHDRE
ncbi:MAG: DUF2142 domain-containing protein [Nocardioides sp.]|nr:DUF2142 domain-containing protein [Nocardioides sp.]